MSLLKKHVYNTKERIGRAVDFKVNVVESFLESGRIPRDYVINILLNGMNKGSEDLKLIILKAGSVDNIDLDHMSKAEKVIEDAKATKDDLIKLLKKLEELNLRKEGEPMKCNYCKMRGHTEEFCRKRRQKNFKPDKKKTINEVSGKAEEKLDELINKVSLV